MKKPHLRFFCELSQIPHISYHEQAVSDYVVRFAQERGLRWLRDEWNNVVIYKPGSKGYEEAAPLMLQAHMDMVGAKEEDSDHDFLTEPLKLRVKDGFLFAEGTTLGADDGHGVSSMLAILDDEMLVHPPLECVFTVQEETGLEGAMKLKGEYFQSKRMIGLDANGETRTVISANGGCTATLTFPIEWEPVAGTCSRIWLGGLLGGHSGKDCLSERGNAIQLMARLLGKLCREDKSLRLCGITGGTKDNVIPDGAEAVVCSSLSPEDLAVWIAREIEQMGELLEYSDSGLKGGLTTASAESFALTHAGTERLAALLTLLPTGVQHRDMTREGHALSSANLGVVRTEEDQITVLVSLRSCVPPEIEHMAEKLEYLAKLTGVGVGYSHSYPGYNFRKDSPLREAYADYTRETLGRELELFAGNGGNEMGVMMSKVKDLDVISMGPWVFDNHTPRERMDLASFDLVYGQLRGFIEKLAKMEEKSK